MNTQFKNRQVIRIDISKEKCENGNKYMKTCSVSPIIREADQVTGRCLLSPLGMKLMEKTKRMLMSLQVAGSP